jgi:ABC-type oligopeptide transport system substrate-binding subunit
LYSLNRDALPAYLKSGDRKSTGVIPPGLPGHRPLPLATQNIEKAVSERKAIKTGVELSLLVPDLEQERKVAKWLEQEFQVVQVSLKIKALPIGAYWAALERGEFDLAIHTWAFNYASPLELLNSMKTGDRSNRGGWTHVGYDTIVNELLEKDASSETRNLLDQAGQILEVQDVGMIPLSYPTQPFLLGGRVVNFATTPFGDPDLLKIQTTPTGGPLRSK